MISIAAEGGYQVFTLGSSEWFWLMFSAVTALLAMLVGLSSCAACSPPTRARRR